MPANPFARLIVAGVAIFSLFLFVYKMQQRQMSEALLRAVMNNRITEVKPLLLRGADVHLSFQDEDAPNVRRIPITEAFNRLPELTSLAPPAEMDDVMGLMLERDKGESYQNKTGAGYLRAACGAGCVRTVRLLLAKKADPLWADANGATALTAVLHGRETVAAQLPVSASKAEYPTDQGQSRLAQRLAAYDQTLQALLAHGIRLNTAQAVQSGNLDLLRGVLSRSGRSAPPEELNMALYVAVGNGQLEAVKLLATHGVNINMALMGLNGQTPLCRAIQNRHEDVARYLVAQGADVNPPSIYQASPLSYAIESLPSLMPVLLRRGASVAHAGVMEAAVRANDPALVKSLLHRGASPDPVIPDYPRRQGHKPARPLAPYTSPDAPLYIAVQYAPDCVEPLLQAGADLRRVGPDILVTAIDSGHVSLIPALLHAGAHVNVGATLATPALLTAVVKAPALVGLLLENGADPNSYDSQARTSLNLAALRDDIAAARLLLSHGAKPDFQPPRGHNALHYARKSKHTAMIALLEKAGATKDR